MPIPNEQTKIIGRSPKFLKALEDAKRVARSTANILITGESGTGKEVLARFIHDQSKSNQGPFIAINCAAIPESLLEAELFGHAKGSFTGAQEKRIGLFEAAQNGTLFLDEIGDMSLTLQVKLLRVLEERKIKRIGENQLREVNCRIISATNKNLSLEVSKGRFREDLFYRLDVIPIYTPPLRERPEDILPLADFFLKVSAQENGSRASCFSNSAIAFLTKNLWRGNVRELENTIERAVVLCDQAEIGLDHLLTLSPTLTIDDPKQSLEFNGDVFSVTCSTRLPSLDEIVHRYIEFAVFKKGGARDSAAREIGIDRKTLYKRLKQNSSAIELHSQSSQNS
jgi:two-component system response regulator HydG